jgi:hypothetical protein
MPEDMKHLVWTPEPTSYRNLRHTPKMAQALREYHAWQAEAFTNPLMCPTCLQPSGAQHHTPCPEGRGPVPCRRYMHTPSPDGLCECGASIAEHSRELYVRKETP